MTHMPFQYGKTRNFAGVPHFSDQEFVVIGAPVDCATTFRSGARFGPNAIRDASMMLTDGYHELYPVDLTDHVGDAGDISLPSGYTEQMLVDVSTVMRELAGRHVVVLGGDHGITQGILRSLWAGEGPSDLALVHFDAHCDTWNGHFGMPHGHGTWLSGAINEGLIDPEHTISVGIRSPADQDSRMFLQNHGGTTISARSAMSTSPHIMRDIIRAKVGDRPAYLSIDIDCLDPAYAPGTGTPEIGGLTTMWLQEVLEGLDDIQWIGMDCVEVSPPFDHSSITSLAAATLVWQYLSMVIHQRGSGHSS